MQSNITVVVGAQWGDEGKGKWIDSIAATAAVVARFQGGNNAGHTIYHAGQKFVLHHLPGGIFSSTTVIALLQGMVINPAVLVREFDQVRAYTDVDPKRLWVSSCAHLITPYHIFRDQQSEEHAMNPIGTTKRGIGPAYADRALRSGLTVGQYIHKPSYDAWIAEQRANDPAFAAFYAAETNQWIAFASQAATIAPFVCPAEARVRKAVKDGVHLMLEGAQGVLLDRDHGTYPYVTSSSTITAGAFASLGLDPRLLTRVIGIAKAYLTRVGGGPMPTELKDSVGEQIARLGQEFGATTGRPRRCGWYDAVAMRYAAEIAGIDALYLNKLDILNDLAVLKIAIAYDHPQLGRLTDFPKDAHILKDCVPVYETVPGWQGDLPKHGTVDALPAALRHYLDRIAYHSGVPIVKVGLGPGPDDYCDLA